MIVWYQDRDMVIAFDSLPMVCVRYCLPTMTDAEKKSVKKYPFINKRELKVALIDKRKSKKYTFTIHKRYCWDPVVTIENFTIETELQCRCGCKRYNFDNEYLIRLQAFRYILNKGLTVTSGGRCVKHNKAVGGVDASCHQCETKKATACDVTNSNCEEIYKRACASGLFNEVIWYTKQNFVHLGLDRNQKGNFFQKK